MRCLSESVYLHPPPPSNGYAAQKTAFRSPDPVFDFESTTGKGVPESEQLFTFEGASGTIPQYLPLPPTWSAHGVASPGTILFGHDAEFALAQPAGWEPGEMFTVPRQMLNFEAPLEGSNPGVFFFSVAVIVQTGLLPSQNCWRRPRIPIPSEVHVVPAYGGGDRDASVDCHGELAARRGAGDIC